jgi:nitroreductase
MLNLLYNRRSTRKFLDKKVGEEKIKSLLTAALLAPSSHNRRPWEFIIVDDPLLLEKLSVAKPHGAALLKHAPLAIIIMGDKTVSDIWIEDCAIVSIIIQLEAEEQGLGSCWVQIHRRYFDDDISSNEYIHNLLDIPERLEVLSIVGIGYKAAQRLPLNNKDILWHKVSKNHYSGQQEPIQQVDSES